MKSFTIIAVLAAATCAAPVETTALKVAASTAGEKVPVCDTMELWDFCLQTAEDLAWCDAQGDLKFETDGIAEKCIEGCYCKVQGMGGL